MSNIQYATNENVHTLINQGYTLVAYYAPWCGPCKQLGLALEALPDTLTQHLTIVKVNIDECGDALKNASVDVIPTLHFMLNGNVIEKNIGAVIKPKLMQRIAKEIHC
ncbi:thiol reductase thioredoxin (plasmid) [Pseudoalteromonas sp. SCSIO 43201]|uniref:Thioredoxin n=1 Tax=Pseudoalteromonas peptidolytica F12-50-A1 TaxID=1315280 RepID=A0A8I0MYM9_9GAMM|nr:MULTISPECIES: thioredoxin domain-containing protein [Pseudoalteromonas]MBE0347903.1 hypothetical protein [Pseudoalteromonas peptidolytica F12-50-A1]NLR15298.1 thioredoxin [Pseudoalteromonas peptidolytica]USD31160.1 thiol reductase thioredoxin [Pseudoalteromonas sp. SCSIO 43201]GEK08022.1 thioredoxin [Pseudoalteromonas peptidolytica]